MRNLLVFVAILGHSICAAQGVSIRKIDISGSKIIVFYSLQDPNPGNEYQLRLYSSVDNFMSPLAKVTGNVGDEVKPGNDLKMEWNIVDEFGPYKGRLSVEIRGKVFVPFVKLQGFDVNKKYKRGKPIDIAWKAGATNMINIELFKGSQRVAGESNLQNNGTHTVYVPSSAKPGNDYRLKITDTRTSDVVYSPVFVVTPAIPLLLKVLPVVAIGGAAAALGGGGGGGTTGTSANTTIALPPFPIN